ncbi:MAG: hypothetical protein FWH03_07250 [Firmicutes bacterium]|nr:hypothetical protein [Bacillota bacterium]
MPDVFNESYKVIGKRKSSKPTLILGFIFLAITIVFVTMTIIHRNDSEALAPGILLCCLFFIITLSYFVSLLDVRKIPKDLIGVNEDSIFLLAQNKQIKIADIAWLRCANERPRLFAATSRAVFLWGYVQIETNDGEKYFQNHIGKIKEVEQELCSLAIRNGNYNYDVRTKK